MYRNAIKPVGKTLYTTIRLTFEMVIKTVQISILVSQCGFTASGVDLARKAGLTLIGRANSRRFVVLSAAERLKFSALPTDISGGRLVSCDED